MLGLIIAVVDNPSIGALEPFLFFSQIIVIKAGVSISRRDFLQLTMSCFYISMHKLTPCARGDNTDRCRKRQDEEVGVSEEVKSTPRVEGFGRDGGKSTVPCALRPLGTNQKINRKCITKTNV